MVKDQSVERRKRARKSCKDDINRTLSMMPDSVASGHAENFNCENKDLPP